MALNAYPFENANTTEDQYTLLFRNFARSGIVGSHSDTQFAVSTDGSGLDVQVAQGYAILRGHAVENDAPATVTLDAADPTNPRIDRVVLRLDPVADGISLFVIKGTPAATPTVPEITRTKTGVWDLPLARIVVPGGALNVISGNIISDREWSGENFGVWDTDHRPTSPNLATAGYNVTLARWEFWSGTAWQALAPSSKKRFVFPHTFTLGGSIVPPTASGDYFVPPFYLPNTPGQTARLVGTRGVVWHGAADSTVSYDILNNSTVVHSGTLTKVAAGSNATADLTAAGTVQLVVKGVVGDPKNVTLTVFVEYEA